LNELKNKLESLVNKEEDILIRMDKSNKILEDYKKKLEKNKASNQSLVVEKEKASTLIYNAKILKEVKVS